MNTKFSKVKYSDINSKKRIVFRRLTPVFIREVIQRKRGKGIYKSYYDDHRCFFIHIPKNAGQAVCEALFGDRYPGHWSYKDFSWENPKKAREYFSFCIVRNPWDRLVSAYSYLKGNTKSELDIFFRDNYLSKYNTFEDFVTYGIGDPEIMSWVHFRPQVEFIKGNDGEIKVNKIGYFEDLNAFFYELVDIIGLDDKKIEKINISKRKKYREYYTEEMKEIVAMFYKEDIETFGYEY